MSPCTLIGTPFSTFTRTISLGLHYKDIPFTQQSTLPHSDLAKANHPFGFIPTLIIHSDSDRGTNDDIKLRESQAIAKYLDRVKPEPSLLLSEREAVESGVGVEEKMWELVSLIASFGFNAVEVGVVKPRLNAQNSGASEAQVREAVSPGIETLKRFLAVTESLMAQNSKFAFASHPTWADFFLFPPLADLRATPEWEDVASKRMKEWMQNMDGLAAVKNTREGTLEVGATP
ncbi:hypothetical protein BJ165DRAFT_1475095 [Panaeolus papilionaceus]|nr:hypothetical protein BJ165DRAFT_1475095 [Panaeolus papilionaceus]